jgi:hypothetical protein
MPKTKGLFPGEPGQRPVRIKHHVSSCDAIV